MRKLYFTFIKPATPASSGLRNLVLLCMLLLGGLATLQAQVTVVQNSNTQALAQLLAGSGVTISNWTKSCANNGSGTFTNVSSNLGVPGGVVLSSGNVGSVPNNANVFASTQFSLNGDAQLSTLTSGTVYDPCVLEFDIVPQGPILQFNYVFASEEYPEWVCSQYNDVFGFFITGPNPQGGNFTNKNIALIPSTNLPVAINTVNPGTPGASAGGGNCNGSNQSLAYTSYYRNNQTPLNANIVYDGMTAVLSATSAVIPCQTYHLKIAIADVADRIYDSGVFLQAYSFISNPVTIQATAALDYAGFTSAYEGCVGGTFTFNLSSAQQVPVVVNLQITGSATNGTDYTTLPTQIVFAPGQTVATLNVDAIADGITESMENVTIAVLDPCSGLPTNSATISIRDDIPPTITVGDSTLCLGQSTQLTANGGVTYSWTPATGLSSTTVKNPIATPTTTTTYTCTMSFGSCTKTVSQTVYVSNPAAAVTANPAGTVCNGASVALTATPSAGQTPYTYLWSTGATTPAISVPSGGSYTVTATDAFGCTASATRSVTISNLSITGTTTNVSCMGAANGAVDITVTGTNAPFTYNWGGGVTSQDRTNLVAGTYSVTASNTVGCSVTATYTITQPASNLTTSATNTSVNCNGGNNGSINLTANGGVTPYTFAWSNSASTEDLNNLVAGTYVVTVTDFNGCTASRSVIINQPTAITTSETHVNNTCAGNTLGSINLTVSGGTGAYSYAWSNGAATQNLTGLASGAYTVTVADANGCTVTRSVTITAPAAISITPAATNPACNAGATGSINLTVTGGTSPYTYNWGGGITTQNRTGLAAGTYNVTVTDNSSCTASASVTLTQPAVLSATNTATNVNCNGGATGAITVTVAGGTSPYTYNWGGGITTQNRTGLTAGTYTVTVTDNQSCTATTSATITQPAVLAATETHTNVSCNAGSNGSIDITVTGGTTPYTYNWGGGVTTEDRSGLAAGTYTITVTDNKGCTVTRSATLTQPTALSITKTSTNITCNAGTNGAVDITVAGGSTAYSYAWSNGATTQDITAIAAGTYVVTVTDANGCTATNSTTITQPTAITITPAITNATCGNADGAITLSVSGGVAGYTYNWGGGITTQNRSGLLAGTYAVTVTDASSCTASASIAVSQTGTGITLSSIVTNVTCNGGTTGAIDLTVTGGVGVVTFNWNDAVTTEDRTGLAAGTYSVTVSDGAGCSAITSKTITQPTAIAITSTQTNILCNGGSTGAINISVSGGTGAYTYNWGGGVTTQNRTGLAAGTYTVTVTDANSCTATKSVTLTQPAAALNGTATPVAVGCFGGNTGSITLTVSGGTTAYSYLWSNGGVSQNLSGLAAGSYTVTITDANGCTTTKSASVTQPAAALALSYLTTNLSCNGVSTGAIDLTVSGGTSAYTYNWGGGVTTQDRTGLAAGTYSVTVTDANSCTASGTQTITQPAAISITGVVTNVSCNGGSNATIDVTTTGGTGAYTYNWGGGITTEDRSALAAGTYTVTATDGNSCTATASFTVTQPSVLTLTLNSGTSVCLNPTGTATAVTNNTGTAPYTYVWSNGGANQQNQTGLAPGPISVTVTDSKGCSASGAVTVGLAGNNTNASFNNTGTYCAPGATVTFTHTGSSNTTGHFWDFGNGSTSTNNNPNYTYATAGTYNVIHIVYRGYCSDTVTNPVVVNPKPVVTATPVNVTCNSAANGAINVTVSSGTPAYTFNWGGGVTTQNRTALAPGSYTVTVSDTKSCSVTASATITQPTALSLSYINTNVNCFGGNNGAIDLTVTGGTSGYTYLWSNSATTQDISSLTGGTYNVTVTDANACTATSAISMYQPSAISLVTSVTNAACNAQSNGAINLTATGGTSPFTYNWGGGVTTQNRTGLAAGTYNVTVTDTKACTATTSAVVTQPATLTTSLTATNVTCYGAATGSIVNVTSGGTSPFTFAWSNGNMSQNPNGLTAGTYTVTATDDNGCTATASIAVTQPASAVSVVVNSANALNCYGDTNGAIDITAAGGVPAYTYNWSDGVTTQDRTNVLGGTYFVTVTDQNSCYATTSATISQPAAPVTIDTLTVSNVLCYGAATGSITTTVSGGTPGYTYNWGGGITTPNRTNVVAGTYNVTVTDTKGCSASASTAVTQPAAALAASVASSTNVSCFAGNNGAINVNVSGGVTPYAFVWNDGPTTQNRTNLTAGTYSIVVTDSNSCTATTSVAITQPAAALSATVASTTNVSCFGGSNGAVTITATGGTTAYTYLWSNAATTQNISGVANGTYTVTVTDSKGCTASTSATVTQPAAALAVAVSSTTNVSCFSGNDGAINITATGGTPAYTYNWGGGVTTQNRTNLTAGTYNVTVTDNKACSASTTATITQPAAALNVAISATGNVSCNGGNNGTITTTVTGGTTAYSYNWGGGITTTNRTGLAAGTYNVTVTDSKSCSATASATITQPAALALSTTHTDVNCFAGNDGTITLTVTGGTTAYSYNWGGGVTTQNRSNLTAGSYTVTVTDANSCTAATTVAIAQPAQLTASSSAGNVSCNGGTNGTINITTNGGITPYTYTWSNGMSGAAVTGLSSGAYTVTVKDQHNCSVTVATTVNQPTSLVLVTAVTNVSCNAGTNGAIDLTVSGGTTGYTYNWGGGITTQDRTNLTAGSYTVTVTDGNACNATISATITQPTAISASTTVANVNCFGGNNGAVNLTVSGGTTPYSFAWSNSATTQNISSLAANTYTVTITDNNSCTATASGIVTQPTQLTLTETHVNVGCNAANTGSINLTVSGGTPAYTYNWSNSTTTQDLSAIAAGTYAVTVTDFKACTAALSVTITQPAVLTASVASTTNVACYGGSNGAITTTVTGGTTAYTYNWGGGVTTPNRNNLAAGTYNLTVTDANSCSATTSATITQPAAALAAVVGNVTNVSCNSGNNGAIDINVNGGTTAYTYSWNGGATTQDRTGLAAGTYSLTVTDANACTASVSATVTQPAAISITHTSSNVLCNGGNTGTVNVAVTGGTAAYSYLWSNGATTQNLAAAASGNYNLTVTDANMCTAAYNGNITITQPAVLTATTSPSNVLCNGAQTGAIQLALTGGTAPFAFTWNDGATTQHRSTLAAGNYRVTVTDANTCSATASTSITQPAQLVTSTSVSNVSCNSGSNGSIDLTVTGGVSAYTFNWGAGITTEDRNTLTAGTYNVTVTDANNCSATAQASVTQPTALTATITPSAALCNGAATGNINLSVSGGVTTYTYGWSNSATTQNIANVTAGSYSVTITDANTCTLVKTATVTEPVALALTTTVTDVACNGGNTGAIALGVTGGTTAYSYNWGAGVTTQNRTNLVAGNYAVTVTDAHSCTATMAATVAQPAALALSETHTNVSCNGGNNASVDLTATGGTSPYTYTWSNSAATEDISNLTAANYVVTLHDNHNCSATLTATVTQPTALAVTGTQTNVLCNSAATGAVNLTVSGGVTSYSFNWSNSATTQNISALTAGTYTATVTDANNCSATITKTITQPAAIAITETHSDVVCNGYATGLIDITVTGGTGAYAYLWSNGDNSQDPTGIVAGAYTVTVTDANACTATSAVTIAQPTPFSINVSSNNVSCNGGTDGNINLTVSGATPGYTFNWNNGATTEDLTAIPAGNYFVLIHDANNCLGNANLTITQPLGLSVSQTHTNVSCNGGANGIIDITVNGGTFPFIYVWSDGANTQDRNGLSAGTYQLTVNDVNSCAVSTPIVITEPAAIAVTLTPTNVTCNGLNNGVVNTTVTGGTPAYTFNWSDGSNQQNANGIVAGNYTVTVTDTKSCVATATTTVTEPAALTVTGVKTDVACFGGNNGAVDVTATGGTTPYTYSWNIGGSNQDISGVIAGTYSVNVTDAKNCSTGATFTISQPAALQVSLIALNASCNGGTNGSIDLTANGGTAPMSYLWSNSATTEDVNGLGAGNYTVAVTDAHGCVTNGNATITAPAAIAIAETHTMPNCNGGNNGTITITVTGGTPTYTYNWSNGGATQNSSNLVAGSYAVTVTDTKGCSAVASAITVAEPAVVGVGLTVTDVACQGAANGQVNVTVNGGTPAYTFHWSNAATTQNLMNVIAGTYSLTVTDSKGCNQTASAFINTLPQLSVNASVDQLVCAQDRGNIDLTVNSGTAPYTFSWNTGATTEDLTNIQPGNYSVIVKDANGCPFDTTFVVVNQNLFNVTASGGGTVTLGQTAEIHASSTGSSETVYNWNPTFGVPCPTCPDNTVQPGHYTLYTVIATDTNGCVAQDTVSVDVIADHTIFPPNGFTPNGDGNNDYFQLFGNLESIRYINIMIFDRWGEKVFEANEPYFKWDGTYKGEKLEPAVYVYVMKIVHIDGFNQKTFKGSITLLR
ncbi:MAG: choice-of-anchor L domain-containing protein [Chitinophagales bacterium]